MNRSTTTSAQRTPAPGHHRALYWAAFAAALVATVAAFLGQAFPGSPEVPGAVCDAPGAAGCNPGDTWAFMAALLGGGLTALVLLVAVATHASHGIQTARFHRANRYRAADRDRHDEDVEPTTAVRTPRRYSDLP